MKRIIRILISIGMIVATIFFVAVFLQPAPIRQREAPPQPKNTVQTAPVKQHDGGIDFTVDGQVIPYRALDIAPEVSGIVKYKSEKARAGKFVRKGEILLEIDPIDYELEIRQLTEETAQAGASIHEMEVQIESTKKEIEISKSQLEIKQRELSRYESVKEPGVYSASEMDNVRTSVLNSRESLVKQENALRLYERQLIRLKSIQDQKKVNLEQAQLNLKRTKIVAPIDGVVKTHKFEVNTYIQKGTVVASILDTSKLEIQCFLHMKQMAWLWARNEVDKKPQDSNSDGAPSAIRGFDFVPTDATVYYELDGQRWSWTGRLTTSDSGSLDPKTRMMLCRVTIDDPTDVHFDSYVIHSTDTSLGTVDKEALEKAKKSQGSPSAQMPPPTLLAGMYVSVVVHAKPEIPLYIAPERALLPGNKIWTATDGTLRQFHIRVATVTDKGVIFYADSQGVTAKDRVVISPLASPEEGDKVNVL